ncbi:Pre-rRNA-processing protein IPI3 [Spathaspora passalidarum NRRL Y-27907]|uniref:Pre-rRNA-processing protein IPI3 n=1 Tax=Spathaspora passalidarum (strain NRRL Y-27907 / 11-Y1) TaxID=619300 RepID=G3AT51_SPAPN|nr:Pre-rRNA-processing protein IPI3 [Spathaspora passalidarum NRRL Y-27907]EGW30814.1 Pre-rRNA-processing protein IPI3 [Spathaspora passalidarum NRRL Y-27907]
MDESIFYIPTPSKNSASHATSIHTSHHHITFRASSSPRNGAYLTGFGPGERLFTCSATKALIEVYSWGKEGVDQRIPLPEALTCLTVVPQPVSASDELEKLTKFRLPWLLAGGTASGKIYIWELTSGDLVSVRDAHYQGITTVKFSPCGTFLVTGGDDARVIVWSVVDLLTDDKAKPYFSITDHTLPITDLLLSDSGVVHDLRLYTTSTDCTVRVYDVLSKSLLTTFVLPYGVNCVAKDPANRALYVGLVNGMIRTIPLYTINKTTSVLESIGGMNKIITIDNDVNLANTFTHHHAPITQLDISLDGTSLISGDETGVVYASDIVTKQIIKTFTKCDSAIAYLKVETLPKSIDSGITTVDKKHRMIPPFKRVLRSDEEHNLFVDIPGHHLSDNSSFEQWLDQKQQEEVEFKNLSDVASEVKQVEEKTYNKDLELKLQRLSAVYSELRTKHEQLIKDHANLLDRVDNQ